MRDCGGFRQEAAFEKSINAIVKERKATYWNEIIRELQGGICRFAELREFVGQIPDDRVKYYIKAMGGTHLLKMLQHSKLCICKSPNKQTFTLGGVEVAFARTIKMIVSENKMISWGGIITKLLDETNRFTELNEFLCHVPDSLAKQYIKEIGQSVLSGMLQNSQLFICEPQSCEENIKTVLVVEPNTGK
ncbi:MAG: hypothetical protein HYT12_02575 [Candidatus Liptonbacteria bacterium]|nr:hypothetical protein [Candidatus Liptonbacteria bacterium]